MKSHQNVRREEFFKKWYEEIVRLQACINARDAEIIRDKEASLSDKEDARERLAKWGRVTMKWRILRRTFIPLLLLMPSNGH